MHVCACVCVCVMARNSTIGVCDCKWVNGGLNDIAYLGREATTGGCCGNSLWAAGGCLQKVVGNVGMKSEG